MRAQGQITTRVEVKVLEVRRRRMRRDVVVVQIEGDKRRELRAGDVMLVDADVTLEGKVK